MRTCFLFFLIELLLSGVSLMAQVEEYKPVIAGPSEEAENFLETFRLPEGTEAALYAAEPMLANPVCFCIDHQGRFYVSETFRHSDGVTDNRNHQDWLYDDLSLQTVEDREKMFLKHLGEQIKDYGIEHERVRQIVDQDGDGVADQSTVFSDHYNHVLDGIGAGLLAHRGKVYYTCVPKFWILEDQNNDGVAELKKPLFHGFGVRVAFLGHDLHGLTLGPDGRIYFSLGDRGYNVKTLEGKVLKKPYTGAVFRCEPDGRNLEVFAYGLRNPQELAFDDYGNLFTGDNNSDSGDKARWVYIPWGSDTGWRMYFQYQTDRGPWNREKIWHLQNEDQPAYTLPPLSHIGDGPSGLVSYPGVGLSERYQGHFFLADFRGNKAISGIRSFGVKPKGASFEVVDQHEYLWSICGTDVDFDYQGNMYVLDWTDGWNKPGKGRLYRFSNSEEKKKQAASLNASELLKNGVANLPVAEIVKLLEHRDRRIRQEAQLVLVKKGERVTLEKVAVNSENQLTRIHAIWGLGQFARAGEYSEVLVRLLSDADPEIRAQAARTIGDSGLTEGSSDLIPLLGDSSPRVQSLAAISIGQLGEAEALESLCKLLEENSDDDPFIRHSAVMGLTGITGRSPELLKPIAKSSHVRVRMGGLLAMRRLHSTQIDQFLNDPDPRLVLEAARAIHDEPIESLMPLLAELGEKDITNDHLARRVMNACYRTGTVKHASYVADMAINPALSEEVRLEALYELSSWNEPFILDRVDGRYRPVPERAKVELTSVITEVLPELLKGSDQVREKTVGLASLYSVREALPVLFKYALDKGNSPAVRVEAIKGLENLESDQLGETVARILFGNDRQGTDPHPEVRSECRRILAELDPERALSNLKKVIHEKPQFSIKERQDAVSILASMKSPEADEVLLDLLEGAIQPGVESEFLLELLEVTRQKSDSRYKELLTRYEQTLDQSDPLSLFRETLAGGDPALGEEVFFHRTDSSCRRCHRVSDRGGFVGPELTHISKEKNREYLLESIIAPEKKIAKGYETVTLALSDGKIISGIVKSESDQEIVLSNGGQKEVITKISKEDIEDESRGKSGMPLEFGKILSRRDIRNLVEYLSRQK